MKINPSAAPSAFLEIGGVRCWRDKNDPSRFYYLAGDPVPELDPSGRPTLLLLASSQGGILQLGTHWTVDDSVLEQMRRALAERFKEAKPELIQFAPVPVAVEGVSLLLGDGTGTFSTLQTSASSGFPPYVAIFSVQVSASQKGQVTAALGGRAGFVRVSYRCKMLAEFAEAPAGFRTDIFERNTDVSTWFAGRDGLNHIQMIST
jgi:hypothetical protein